MKAGLSYVEYNMQSKKRTIKNLVYSKTYFWENMKFVWIVKNIRAFYGHWHFLTLGKNSLTFMMGGWKYLSYSQVFLRPLVRWRKLNHVYKHRCRYWHTQINYVTVLIWQKKAYKHLPNRRYFIWKNQWLIKELYFMKMAHGVFWQRQLTVIPIQLNMKKNRIFLYWRGKAGTRAGKWTISKTDETN